MAKRRISRRVAGKGRSRQNGKAAGGFGIIALVGSAAYVIGYGIAALIIAVITGLIAGIFAALQVRDNGGRLWRPETVATTKKPAHVQPVPKNYVRKTAKVRLATRRTNLLKGVVHQGTTTVRGRDGVCSSSCQNSRAPKRFCRCPGCGGSQHGSARGVSAVIPRIASEILSGPPSRPKAKPNPSRGAKAGLKKPTGKNGPMIPAGPAEMQLIVVWRNDDPGGDGKVRRVQTSKATAEIMRRDGMLLRVEGKAPGWVDAR